MGEATKIQWTDYSWSPWHGCQKVSPGCQHCYAEALSKRNPAILGEWGPDGVRVVSRSFDKPLAWDRKAKAEGVRRRVFPSLCDPFEDRPELVGPRRRFLDLIDRTEHLDYLVLTKRPENVPAMLAGYADWCGRDLRRDPYPNLWLGVSVESEDYLWRADRLREIPAAVRFLSLEPLLGPLPGLEGHLDGIHWAIVGGESGAGARPFYLEDARDIRDACRAADVAFFFKQTGALWYSTRPGVYGAGDFVVADFSPGRDPKGGDITEFPHDLRIREFPAALAAR